MKRLYAFFISLMFVSAAAVTAGSADASTVSVRDHYIDVKVYPDYNRRSWPMPGWKAFDDKVQLVGDRYVTVDKTKQGGSTGTVFRPNYDFLRIEDEKKFTELLSRIKDSHTKLFVWNLGGYGWWTVNVGGSVKYNYFEQLQSVLGEQFLGCDIGEQDGHYANGYKELTRLTEDPFEEYFKLHMILQRVAEDQADKTSQLTVMYNWHDMIRDGAVVSAAAECQNRGGVTGIQVHYAFLRGASRQYGVTISGDVSVFTSWDKYWASLALRRRMLYSQYQWNTTILSSEDAYGPAPVVVDFNNWMNGFLEKYPRLGPVQCPVALLTDPFQGWIPSQTHIGQFKKHVQMAYEPGDFLTHLLLNVVYPEYYDNGVWKDESRALVPTPYGDITEVITSDCPGPVLNGYGAVIAASDLPTGGIELRDRLEFYAGKGGHLVITAANARRLWPEWNISSKLISFPEGSKVCFLSTGETITEPLSFDIWGIDPNVITGAVVTAAAEDGTPIVLTIRRGDGTITVLASAYGLNSKPVSVVERRHPIFNQSLDSAPEQVQPYSLLEHVRKVVDTTLKSQQLFSVGNSQLAFIVNRMDAGTYLVGIYNSKLIQQPFKVQCLAGEIVSQNEIQLDDLAKKYPLFAAGYSGDGKPSTSSAIAAGDVRFFKVAVKLHESRVRVVSHPVFPPAPVNRFAMMQTLPDLERSLLRWPTFFQHFDGVMFDWSQFRDIDSEALQYDCSRWLNRQKLRFVADFRTAQQGKLLSLNPSAKNKMMDFLKPIVGNMDILKGARDLLFSAGTVREVEALAAVAGDTVFAGYAFHVLPLTVEARQALQQAEGGGRLLSACTDVIPAKVHNSVKSGMMLIMSDAVAVNHKDTVTYPGIQVLDASYFEWDTIYADLKNAWERPGSLPMAGQPVRYEWVTGKAVPIHPDLYLSLRDPGSIERALKKIDPVWKDFAGVKLESSLVWKMSHDACRRLGERFRELGLKVIVDFSDHLDGRNGLTFIDLSATMKTPSIGSHARSKRVFESVSAKMPLIGAKDALLVMSPSTTLMPREGDKDAAQAKANRACFDEFCRMLRDQGVAVHLWSNPYRNFGRGEVMELIKATPGAKVALNLNVDADLAGGVTWAGRDLGMIVIGGGTFARQARNSIKTSTPYDGLMYGPLSLRTTPLPALPRNVPLVLDGDYGTVDQIKADLKMLAVGK